MEGLKHFGAKVTSTTWKSIKKQVYLAAEKKSMDAELPPAYVSKVYFRHLRTSTLRYTGT